MLRPVQKNNDERSQVWTTAGCEKTHRYLGRSGIKVSKICLGTMTFGEMLTNEAIPVARPGQTNEADSYKLLDRFTELGGNFIDTANSQDHESVVIGTKVRMPMSSTNPNSVGLSRKHIIASVENSLERLKTNYIDLLQIHAWDSGTPLLETLTTLNDLVRCDRG
ncbi:unnamed protein product [Didymodactylos carnosus]|uniref:NADP-dependent oxidoreductase domain-containing protein n=1 Tax=Didymodactylos carnosus TaxID=1234261 RepID=A0A8S2PWY1_9BILA|nr:unnamed protein product [Didymodactylos carnosus]CAF4073690.1 unnamed protein product [Didymodactylos carnosus]